MNFLQIEKNHECNKRFDKGSIFHLLEVEHGEHEQSGDNLEDIEPKRAAIDPEVLEDID